MNERYVYIQGDERGVTGKKSQQGLCFSKMEMDKVALKFKSLCAQLRSESLQHAGAFREERHREALAELILQRAQGQAPLQHTTKDALEWGETHDWLRGEQSPESKRATLEAFVQGDARLLFRLWTVATEKAEKASESPLGFNDLVLSYLRTISNTDLLYSKEVVIGSEKEKRSSNRRQAGRLFGQKILMGNVKPDLRDVRVADLFSGAQGDEDDWMEQMMPSELWLGVQVKFLSEELSKADQRVTDRYQHHSFGIRWVMRNYPMMTQIDVAEEKLRAWRHARRAWLSPPKAFETEKQAMFDSLDIMGNIASFRLSKEEGEESKWYFEALAEQLHRLRDHYLNTVPMQFHASIAGLFHDELKSVSLEDRWRLFAANARDFQILYGELYSRDYVYDVLLTDPEKTLFPKLFNQLSLLSKGELVESAERRDGKAMARTVEQLRETLLLLSQILKQRASEMEDAFLLSKILLHEFLPLSEQPMLLYRFMQHSLRLDDGPWLWRILDDLDKGGSTVHFDLGVQSTTYNPLAMLDTWVEQPWTVVFSILCPKSSRLFHIPESPSMMAKEFELLIRPRAILDITSYRVVPNFVVRGSGSARLVKRHPWLVVLYCTLRL